MWLKKETGATTIKWEGRDYEWPADNPVCEVPQALGQTLLNIHGGGYSEAPRPAKPAPAAQKQAPAAAAKA